MFPIGSAGQSERQSLRRGSLAPHSLVVAASDATYSLRQLPNARQSVLIAPLAIYKARKTQRYCDESQVWAGWDE